MIDLADAPGPTAWKLSAIEEDGSGKLTAATLTRGEETVRLVQAESVLDEVARMDPIGKLIGSTLAEVFIQAKMGKGERLLRQAGAAAEVAYEKMAGEPVRKMSAAERRKKKRQTWSKP